MSTRYWAKALVVSVALGVSIASLTGCSHTAPIATFRTPPAQPRNTSLLQPSSGPNTSGQGGTPGNTSFGK